MKCITTYRSPNYDDREISVEYVVLHYTATTLARTLEIFMTRDRASSHLVIDSNGDVYELVPCLDVHPRRAWHAGKSRLARGDGSLIEGFNDRSIGIELVNLNGNIFSFTDEQYRSLCEVIGEFRDRYPALATPDAILGHEDIAGFRGKCDPGRRFDWERLIREVYPGEPSPNRPHRCPERIVPLIRAVTDSLGVLGTDDLGGAGPVGDRGAFCESFNVLLEGLLADS